MMAMNYMAVSASQSIAVMAKRGHLLRTRPGHQMYARKDCVQYVTEGCLPPLLRRKDRVARHMVVFFLEGTAQSHCALMVLVFATSLCSKIWCKLHGEAATYPTAPRRAAGHSLSKKGRRRRMAVWAFLQYTVSWTLSLLAHCLWCREGRCGHHIDSLLCQHHTWIKKNQAVKPPSPSLCSAKSLLEQL